MRFSNSTDKRSIYSHTIFLLGSPKGIEPPDPTAVPSPAQVATEEVAVGASDTEHVTVNKGMAQSSSQLEAIIRNCNFTTRGL